MTTIELLSDAIKCAKDGDKKAIGKLRDLCRRAADAAPPEDLIRMSQFLLDLRVEADMKHSKTQ